MGEASLSARRPPLALDVRLARPSDKPAILAFATATWDGWDYIPAAWDAWLAAAAGVVLVACTRQVATGHQGQRIAAGQPVAMVRLALLAPGEAWLEGIRVDPAVRGRDVATNLQVAELAWAAAHQARVVRYATGQENEGSHRLGARHGFTRLADRRAYGPPDQVDATSAGPGGAGDPAALRRVPADADVAEVTRWWRLVDDDPTFAAGDRLYEARSWAFQELDEARFAAHVQRGDVVVARDGGALLIVTRPHEAGERGPEVALLAGAPAAALDLLADLRRATGAAPHVRLPDPDPPLLGTAGRERWSRAGLAPHRGTLHLLARRLDDGSALPVAVPPGILALVDRPRRLARPGW